MKSLYNYMWILIFFTGFGSIILLSDDYDAFILPFWPLIKGFVPIVIGMHVLWLILFAFAKLRSYQRWMCVTAIVPATLGIFALYLAAFGQLETHFHYELIINVLRIFFLGTVYVIIYSLLSLYTALRKDLSPKLEHGFGILFLLMILISGGFLIWVVLTINRGEFDAPSYVYLFTALALVIQVIFSRVLGSIIHVIIKEDAIVSIETVSYETVKKRQRPVIKNERRPRSIDTSVNPLITYVLRPIQLLIVLSLFMTLASIIIAWEQSDVNAIVFGIMALVPLSMLLSLILWMNYHGIGYFSAILINFGFAGNIVFLIGVLLQDYFELQLLLKICAVIACFIVILLTFWGFPANLGSFNRSKKK